MVLPQGKVTDFPLEGLALLEQYGCHGIQVYPCTGSPTATPKCHSPVPPTLNSPQETAVLAALPSLVPKMSSYKHKTCALAPLRIKNEKKN